MGNNLSTQMATYEDQKRQGHVYSQRPSEFNPNRYVSVRTYENVKVGQPISEEDFNSRVRRTWFNYLWNHKFDLISLNPSSFLWDKYVIMRNLWVSRSHQPNIISLSEFFLSIATGNLKKTQESFLSLIFGTSAELSQVSIAIFNQLWVSTSKHSFYCSFRNS